MKQFAQIIAGKSQRERSLGSLSPWFWLRTTALSSVPQPPSSSLPHPQAPRGQWSRSHHPPETDQEAVDQEGQVQQPVGVQIKGQRRPGPQPRLQAMAKGNLCRLPAKGTPHRPEELKETMKKNGGQKGRRRENESTGGRKAHLTAEAAGWLRFICQGD